MFICNRDVNCDIIALQELPIKFEHGNSDLTMSASDVLPELIIKLDEREIQNKSDDRWAFGYSEDFPQDCWKEYRNVKSSDHKPKLTRDKRGGDYIHAFIYKKNKIICHSVEQVIDLQYQENRFKHAPSLGRFTLKEKNFHFSLCNVHMRPYLSVIDNSYHE